MTTTHPVSIDLIKAKLLERMDQLVCELFPNARRQGNEWVMGDIFGSPGTSLSICRHGAKAGWWRDFAGTASGDVLTLIAAGACDGDVRAAVPYALNWLGLGAMSADDLRRQEEKARASREQAEARWQSDIEKTRGRAKALYLAGLDWPGTPVERYLLGRAMDLGQLPRLPRSPRWHAKVWNSEAGKDLPAMLAPVNDGLSGQMLGVHRTWLSVHPDGQVHKAPLLDAKKSWGAIKGGHIPLNRGASDKALKDAPAGEWIGVAEGIENGFSAALISPHWRVIAAVSIGNIGFLKLPPQIGGLFLIGDNDTKPDAIAAFTNACAQLEARGIAYSVVKPPPGVKDFNDWLKALGRAGKTGVG